MKEDRPKLKLQLSITDKLLEVAGVGLLMALWIWVWVSYKDLPAEIPTHFNFKGEADAFGGKESVFVESVFATILFIAVTIVNRYPHHFNYLSKITKENALQKYTSATRILRILKIIIVVVFGIGTYSTINYNSGGTQDHGPWPLIIFIVLLFVPLVWITYVELRKK